MSRPAPDRSKYTRKYMKKLIKEVMDNDAIEDWSVYLKHILEYISEVYIWSIYLEYISEVYIWNIYPNYMPETYAHI